MKTIDDKNHGSGSILSGIFSCGSKISVLLLFVLLFIAGINPARISSNIAKDVSLIKSAFFFRSLTSDIVALDKSDSADSDDSGLESFSLDGDTSYDDFYAAMEMMAASDDESDADDSDYDDDSEFGSAVAEKITAVKYGDVWKDFSEKHPEIADAMNFDRFASILTVAAVLVCIAGFYLSFGGKKARKIGYMVILAGCVLVALSMLNFNTAYSKLSSSMDMLDVGAYSPHGIPVFVIFSLIAFALAAAALFLDRQQESSDDILSAVPFRLTYRLLALLLFILLFIPAANPARISEEINRNVSLFTSGFFYGTYTENMQRILIRGWLPESVMRIAFFSSMLACLGVIACGAGSCMSVGNNRLKFYGHISIIAGSAVTFLSMFGISRAYTLMTSSPNVSKLSPVEPSGIVIFGVLSVVIFVSALISALKTPLPAKDEKCHIDAPLQLFLMILPFLLLVFIFAYLPLWGWRYAFFDYNPGDVLSMDKWVGLKWFKAPFENAATRSDILRVLKNTLAMSGLGILTSWCPMIFAVFLAEIRNGTTRRIIQTLTTVPNFISWVLVYAIAFCIFGTEGFISSLMVHNGIWEQGKNMLMGDSHIWLKMLLWGIWKGLGWSAIMYIAAISGIDQQLYEAATVDGAGRFQRIWHITLPELIPTYIVLLILSVSNILSNGMDQYLVFKNSTNKGPIEVLDLYVYQLTFDSSTGSNIPFSTVVSMFKSLVSVLLLFTTNKISKWIRGSSIF